MSAFVHICVTSWLENSPLMSLVLAEPLFITFTRQHV